MSKIRVVAGLAAIAAIAIAVPAIAGSDAQQSASAKKTAKKALRKAKKAVRIARKTSKQEGPAGPPGPPGPESVAAWAHVSSTGTVVAGEGITTADVDRDATGVFCFASVPEDAESAVATASSAGSAPENADWIVNVGLATNDVTTPNWGGCAQGTDNVRVTVLDAGTGDLFDQAFHIWFTK